jgi:catechol 2,3-dioxygenase-like lactoylglutathione lyase family enzyme
MIKTGRIGHATFETPDLDKAIAHYTQVVGLVLTAREKDRAFLASRLGMLAVTLEKAPRARCSRLSFEIAPTIELADAARMLEAEGIRSERRNDTAPGVSEVLSFADPKGTAIDLFTQWKPLAPVSDPVGTGVLKLGHLAFVVDDPKPIAEFYQRVLGFRVSDWIEDWFVFLRCNADHHVVNFIRGPKTRMHHFAFEVKDFSQLQHGCEILGNRGIPISWGPVRLGPGHNVAIFHRNADDQMIEFYAELDQMKDEDLGYFDPRPWHRDQPQRPKVWTGATRYMWGPPPTPDFLRAQTDAG